MRRRFTTLLTIALLSALLVSTGCTTSMTNMTEARAYKPGEFQVAVNMQGNAHTSAVGGLAKAAQSARDEFDADSDAPISEESFRDWLDGVLLLAMFKPGVGPELIVRGGVTEEVLEGLDVGLKVTPSLLQGSAKLQVYSSDVKDRHAVSVMLGYTKHFSLVNSAVEYATLTEFKRRDVDMRVLYGWTPTDWLRMTVAPHLIVSRISTDSKLPDWLTSRLPEEVTKYNPNQLFQDEWLVLSGLNIGAMVGYKYAFLAIDTGFFWMNFKPTVIGKERDYSGAAFSMAGGLSFNYKFF